VSSPAPFRAAAIRAGRMLVVGAGPGLHSLRQQVASLRGTGLEVVGVVAASRPGGDHGWPYLGDLAMLPRLLSSEGITDVAMCMDAPHGSYVEWLAAHCSSGGIRLHIPAATATEGAPVTGRVLRGRDPSLKRAMDVVGGVAGLIVFSPILIAAAIAVAIVDGRPIFFRQLRAGRGGQPFRILKYRTMQPGADAFRGELRAANEISAGAFKIADDPRVTRLGKWLRRTSIDELPQLWNVIRGEMSLVGPRPHPYDDVAGYQPWHLRRLAVKPGMTGLWQVELRGDPDFDKWVRKDIEYIERWSIWLDLTLIVRTLPAVLRGTGR